jgi:hypothetical protein
MFFYFLKIIFKINVSKQSKIYNFFLIFNKKTHLNFLNRQCQSELCTCSSLLYTYVMYSIFRQFKIRTDNSFYFCAGKHVVGTPYYWKKPGSRKDDTTRQGAFSRRILLQWKEHMLIKLQWKAWTLFFFFSLSSPTQIATKNWNWVETWEGRGGERCFKCWIA